MTNLQQEVWEDIAGFEGIYQISNYGRVLSVARHKKLPNGGNGDWVESRIIGARLMNGYPLVTLKKPSKIKKDFLVHRLVAFAFIPNPDGKTIINHIDCNTKNNHFSNLEWCTQYENVHHMKRMGRERKFMRPVKQFSSDGLTEIATWISAAHAARGCGVTRVGISHCCTGRQFTSGGFHWAYSSSGF